MKNQSTIKKEGHALFILAFLLITNIAASAGYSDPANPQNMKAVLYNVSSTGIVTLLDGNLTNYDDAFTNAAPVDDALKMNNFGENFGIIRDGMKLAVEQRKTIGLNDTSFFVMWNMQVKNYRLVLIAENLNHSLLQGFLEDSYLHTSTSIELNDTTNIDFSVSADAASYAIDRFRIIYKTPVAPALFGFTDLKVSPVNRTGVQVQWSVQNETAIQDYTVEHSAEGINFTAVKTAVSLNGPGIQAYQLSDPTPRSGDNYYRIKATGRTGSIQYSDLVKISLETPVTGISIYPNPVVGKTIQLHFNNQPAGKYSIVLISSNGTMQMMDPLEITTASGVRSMPLPKNTATGIYRLRITSPENISTVKTINVL